MSHKGEERKNFKSEFKCKTIEYAEKNRHHRAAKKIMLLLNGLENGHKTY